MVEEKILIVDDDDVELKRDSDILKAVGYEVIGCKSGAEALEYGVLVQQSRGACGA